ncbi:MAG TPA: patatin-like phospholipase family protein [Trueperaceae bacterium]
MAAESSAHSPLGLALGGGTARGLAHVGALKVLESKGLAPDVIAGTSYGAVIAALYAIGMPAVELEDLVRRQNILELWSTGLDFGLHRGSFIHGRRLERWLDRKVFFGATFADCMMPLAVACTDVATGELHVLREGSLAKAVVASSALPAIFAPVVIDGRVLIDGGFVEAVPFRALQTLNPRTVIGIHAGVDPESSALVRMLRRLAASRVGVAWARMTDGLVPTTSLRSLARGISCALASYSCEQRVPPGAMLVRADPPLSWWDFHRSPEAIAAGEAAMRRALEKWPLSASATRQPKA